MQAIDLQKEAFVKAITNEVSKKIAKKYHLSLDEATNRFRNTKTFNFLAYSDDPFIEDDPDDFFELFENEKQFGRMVTNEQLRLEREKNI